MTPHEFDVSPFTGMTREEELKQIRKDLRGLRILALLIVGSACTMIALVSCL